MADVIKDYNTDELIEYLRRKDLKLKELHFKIFRQEEITSLAFLETTKDEFRNYGIKGGPATFNLVFKEINDGDKTLEQCMNEITLRLSNLETMQANANEATHVSGEEVLERVNYAIKGNENLICIAEKKSHNTEIGYLQNIIQLESAYHTNKKKRTTDQAFHDDDYDYFYRIVSTDITNICNYQ
ncbi:hypothetical protein Glove_326g98 [Diversispora epigaea]|uniref:SAM domain-containing protein n=1 Tax=Diversispora epigaea TaxID=1348612 RepID=A0A397HRN1_9GLOM|nr:hypothetical protein Glove_326g98 [Diversispora epigaea]